ncbi:MAG TPA: LAGLIDADG family homing endonuclease [Candidatus Paceibacterota bacterium]|nr:LAGLIDADG family homing endonuclease [Candidatus Paceibacterota bacterium]
MGRTLPTVSNDYVVGLTDGEGCFYVNIWKSSAYRAGAGVQLHFHLKMQERDRDLLEAVKNTIGCGAVYFQKEQRTNHCQCYRYTVSATRDILSTVIPFFKQYPLQSATKRASFELFCQIAQLVQAGRHRTIEGLEEIRVLKSRMNQKTVGLA